MRQGDARLDELIDCVLSGDASDAQVRSLLEWRAVSPENDRRFRQAEQLYIAAQDLARASAATSPRPAAGSIVATVAKRTTRRRALVRRVKRSTPWAVAAAAVLVLALNQRAARESAVWSPTEIVTGATELATVRLEDGSVVRLAPSSRLQVHGGAERDVTLEGRAYFAVTKDDSRPFRVRTAAGTAQVLGTRFEIATDAEGLRLFVLEGRVALDAPANRVEVGAGEQSGVRNGAATLPARFADAENAAAWLGKFLAFQATPLREAAREIERLYEVNVLVADSALAVTTITATFTDRPLQAVTDVVCLILSARCSTKQDTVIISR